MVYSSQPGPYVLGLTGTIGSGKSKAAEIFERLGATVIDADVLAREVVKPGSAGLQALLQAFGQGVLKSDGTLDRSALGKIVFSNPAERKRLEDLLHPLIRARFRELLKQAQSQRNPPSMVVYVAPLLLEAGVPPEVQAVALVVASQQSIVERVMARDHLSANDVAQRMAAQMPQDEKLKRAQYVINNSGSLDQLESNVTELYSRLTSSLKLTGPNT